MAAKKGNKVKVHYTGRLDNGEVFDSSVNKEPLEFQLGTGQMIPGFENAIMGLHEGEKITTTVPADEAYGERRDDLMFNVPRSNIPENIDPHVGQKLSIKQPDGQMIPVTVANIKEDAIIIDANHPLAGRDLIFEIELVGID
jgi:peptidylprolyl isomerase